MIDNESMIKSNDLTYEEHDIYPDKQVRQGMLTCTM